MAFSHGGGGIGGLGQPGERVSGRMDIWSELYTPLLQALAKVLVAPLVVAATFMNVFLLQPEGWFVLIAVLIILLLAVILVGGRFIVQISGLRLPITLPGVFNWKMMILVSTPFTVIFLMWLVYGYGLICTLWFAFWPEFTLLWIFPICLACMKPPVWMCLFMIPSSYGIYRAARLLNFRLSYEITDPYMPATIRQRDWDGRAFGPGYSVVQFPAPRSDEPIMFRKRTSGTTELAKLVRPPDGCLYSELWDWCSHVNMAANFDKAGNYKVPGEGKTGVSQDCHRALCRDWLARSFLNKLANNQFVTTTIGSELLRHILEYERPSDID